EIVRAEKDKCRSYCTAYKWTVPANAQGQWRLDGGGLLGLTQEYQMLSGYLERDGERHELSDARMQGKEIGFTVNGQRYTGKLEADKLSGEDAAGTRWSAARQ